MSHSLPLEITYIIGNSIPIFIGGILYAALSTFIFYLWLLIFIKPDIGRIKKVLEPAAIFAIAFFIILELIAFALNFQSNFGSYDFTFNLASAISLVNSFVFGILIFYHIYQKKLGQEAYLFTGLYLAPSALSALMNILAGLLSGEITGGGVYFSESGEEVLLFVNRTFELGLIYFISKAKLK